MSKRKLKSSIYLRADGNSEIGHGHIARLMALAYVLQKLQAPIIFVTCNSSNEIIEQVSALPSIVLKQEEDLFNLIDKYSIVVLDGYLFSTEYHQRIKSCGAQLVYYDDFQKDNLNVADTIINVSGDIVPNQYKAKFYTQIYSGPDYAVVNKRFLNRGRLKPECKSLLICFGGADPNNFSCKVMRRLRNHPLGFEEVHLVVGGSYKYIKELEALISSFDKNLVIEIHYNISAHQMAELMSKCESALLPPSTIAYEYCYIGGQLYLLQTADNQSGIYEFLIKNRLGLSYEDLLQNITLKNSISRQRQFFNGEFKSNLLRVFTSHLLYSQLEIREAKVEDCKLYFEWANDPEVRAQSFNSEPIHWDDHQLWFKMKLDSSQCKLYFVELNGVPVGQVRFDFVNGNYVIDYSLGVKSRGRGLGLLMMKLSILTLIADVGLPVLIEAQVKKTNYASKKVLERLNFERDRGTSNLGGIAYSLNII